MAKNEAGKMILLYILALKMAKNEARQMNPRSTTIHPSLFEKTIHPNSKYHGKEKTPKFTLHCVANL
jgi:hypothetical protein